MDATIIRKTGATLEKAKISSSTKKEQNKLINQKRIKKAHQPKKNKRTYDYQFRAKD